VLVRLYILEHYHSLFKGAIGERVQKCKSAKTLGLSEPFVFFEAWSKLSRSLHILGIVLHGLRTLQPQFILACVHKPSYWLSTFLHTHPTAFYQNFVSTADCPFNIISKYLALGKTFC
jgi:hypothetical protein